MIENFPNQGPIVPNLPPKAPGDTLSVMEAQKTVMGIFNEVMMLGANDSEKESFISLFQDLVGQAITPEMAIQKAVDIRDSKNAYH